jgi:hypothetical protein
MPSSIAAASPASLMVRSTSSFDLMKNSSIFVGWMRPSWMSRSSVSRAISRRTGSKLAHHDGLGRVVDHQVAARDLLEGADVPALAADDAPLELVARQVHRGHRALARVLPGVALHRDADHPLGALLGLFAREVLDLLGLARRPSAARRRGSRRSPGAGLLGR